MPKFFMLWVLLALSNNGFGQNLLLFQSKKHLAYYNIGDKISIKLKNKSKVSGPIERIDDSLIVFKHGREVKLDDIYAVYLDGQIRGWSLKYKVDIFLIAGVGFLLADLVNSGKINPTTLKISGTLVGVGLLAKLLVGNKIKIKGNRRFKVIQIFM